MRVKLGPGLDLVSVFLLMHPLSRPRPSVGYFVRALEVCTACTEVQQIFSRGAARNEAQCDEGVVTDGIRLSLDGTRKGPGGERLTATSKMVEVKDYSIYEK